MPIRILQTADPFRYRQMLEATARTATEFARRHGHEYESYVGIKRGKLSGHATFNRMFLLRDLHESGYRGWALYMDADAYIWDLDFDIDAYLAGKGDRAAVMATIEGQPTPWSVNAGVLLFNMAHPLCRRLLDDWTNRFLAVPEDVLSTVTSVWSDINDQGMLFDTLQESEVLRDAVYFEQALALNHKDGTFIRQYLGAFEQDIGRRTEMVELEVGYVLRGTRARRPSDTSPRQLVASLYQEILGREPDAGGMAHYLEHIDTYGMSSSLISIASALRGSEEYKDRLVDA